MNSSLVVMCCMAAHTPGSLDGNNCDKQIMVWTVDGCAVWARIHIECRASCWTVDYCVICGGLTMMKFYVVSESVVYRLCVAIS